MGGRCCKPRKDGPSEFLFEKTPYASLTVVDVDSNGHIIFTYRTRVGNIYLTAYLHGLKITKPMEAQQFMQNYLIGEVVVVKKADGLLPPTQPFYVFPVNVYWGDVHINQYLVGSGFAEWLETEEHT